MAIVTFSVPDKLKRQFERAFAREDKNRVIALLMMRAVEERRVQKERARAIDAILPRRRTQKPVSNNQIRVARVVRRPR